MLVAHFDQCRLDAAAFENADGLSGKILPGSGLEAVDVVDQHRLDCVIGRRIHERIPVCGGRTRWWPINPAGADHRSAWRLGQPLHRVVGGDDPERQAVLSREHTCQIVVEAGSLIIRAAKPGNRSLTQEHDQIVTRRGRRSRRRWRGRGTARGQRDRSDDAISQKA